MGSGVLKTQTGDQADLRFGKRLRLERERRRITLDSIAANTKIGLGLLKGLERDDVSRWPTGIFRRSFIREYAAAIGLDPDETTREFLERFPDPGEPTKPAPARTPDDPVLRLTLADTDSRFMRGRIQRVRWGELPPSPGISRRASSSAGCCSLRSINGGSRSLSP